LVQFKIAKSIPLIFLECTAAKNGCFGLIFDQLNFPKGDLLIKCVLTSQCLCVKKNISFFNFFKQEDGTRDGKKIKKFIINLQTK